MGLPQAFNVEQAAAYAKVTTSTIQRWISAGFLPTRKKVRGGGHEILDTDLDACLVNRRLTWGQRTPKRPKYLRQKLKIRERTREERDKWNEYMRQYRERRKLQQGD